MRLIDADYAKTLFDGDHPINVTMRRIFDDLPTIDPDVPVKRGQWIEGKDGFRCSNCKKEPGMHPKKRGVFLSRYCPSCGALMEG